MVSVTGLWWMRVSASIQLQRIMLMQRRICQPLPRWYMQRLPNIAQSYRYSHFHNDCLFFRLEKNSTFDPVTEMHWFEIFIQHWVPLYLLFSLKKRQSLWKWEYIPSSWQNNQDGMWLLPTKNIIQFLYINIWLYIKNIWSMFKSCITIYSCNSHVCLVSNSLWATYKDMIAGLSHLCMHAVGRETPWGKRRGHTWRAVETCGEQGCFRGGMLLGRI